MKGCQRVLRGARGVLLALVVVEGLLQIGGFLVAVLTRTSRSTAAGGAEGTIRIVCLGDSHTFGVGASEGSSSYPSQLEQRLARCWDKPVRVINLGVPGQNSSQVTKSVEQVMTRQRPSLLLVLVGVNNQWNFVDVNLLEPSIAQRVAQLLSHLKLYRFAALLSASFRAPRWFWARTDPGVDGSVNAAEDTAPPRPRQADATGPDPLPDLLQEGWRAMRAEDFQLARKRFALADQHHPGDPEILYGLGMSYWRLGQLSEAIRTLRDALTKDPERAEIYKTLGTVYFDGYEYGQAVEALAKAAVLAPNDAWVHRLLGRLYVRLGGWTQTTSTLLALEELQQAFILDGDVTETFIEVSHIFHHPAERLFVMDSWIAQTGHQLSPTERRLLATHRHLLRQTGSERPDFTVGDAVLARDLERILRIANIHRVPLYLLTYAADVPQNSVIRAIAQRNRVPLIDVAAAMDQVWDTRRDQFFMLDRHPNDRGYAMMADIVAEALSRGCPSHVRLPAATPTAS